MPGIIIGLTGCSGSGKSTVSAYFSKKGAVIIDCDKTAGEITQKGSPVLDILAEAFGADIILPDGNLDRKKLSARAFANKSAQEKLNSITHPAIISLCKDRAYRASAQGKNVIIDAPLLFESGLDKICLCTVAVLAPEEIRLERIMKRDSIDKDAALRRFSVQKTDAELTALADYTIKNYPPYNTYEQADRIYESITQK